MESVSDLGVSLAIDDFGTGYSCLGALKRLPVDAIKIDQSFVRALTTDPADATITETIVRMAAGLNLTTIAEGVETRLQLDELQRLGCHQAVGYYLNRPLPATECLPLLTRPPTPGEQVGAHSQQEPNDPLGSSRR